MGSKRSFSDDFAPASPKFKKAKVTLEEEVIIIMDGLEVEEEQVKDHDGDFVEPDATDSVILLLHICFLCGMELDCAPGDLVMKTHYISHFSPGSLLEMVGQDVGEKLRCPYSECHIREEMLLQQLNLHLEVVHNKLRMLLEKDTSPGMAEVLSIMYDFDGYKEKNFSENELSPNEEVKSEISLDPPPMKAKIKKTNVDEEYLEVKCDPSLTQPLDIDDEIGENELLSNEEVKSEKSLDLPPMKVGIEEAQPHDEQLEVNPLYVDEEEEEERNDPPWAPHVDDLSDEENDSGESDEEQNDPEPLQSPPDKVLPHNDRLPPSNQTDEVTPLYSVEQIPTTQAVDDQVNGYNFVYG